MTCRRFCRYPKAIDQAAPSPLAPPERLAPWISAYNAYTIQLIIAHRERTSIRNINGSLGLLRVEGPVAGATRTRAGRAWSLDVIEHDINRTRFREPRIHFALVCRVTRLPAAEERGMRFRPARLAARRPGGDLPAGVAVEESRRSCLANALRQPDFHMVPG